MLGRVGLPAPPCCLTTRPLLLLGGRPARVLPGGSKLSCFAPAAVFASAQAQCLQQRGFPIRLAKSFASTISTAATGSTTTMADAAAAKPPAIPEVPSGMAREEKLLSAFLDAPTIGRAVLRGAVGGHLTLQAYLNQRNLPANNQRKYMVSATVLMPQGAGAEQPSVAPTVVPSAPMELPDALMMSTSPSGKQQLLVRAGPEGCSAMLQVWRGGKCVMELAVPKGLHGAPVNDGYFASGVSWAPGEEALAYVAEAPVPERTPAWGGPESLKDAAGPRSWRGQGPALEDWGELNTGKREPVVVVFDIKAGTVAKVATSGLPAEHSMGQPTWVPSPTANGTATADGTATAAGPSGLLLVAWPHAPTNFGEDGALARKLGVVFCYNRPSHLFHVPMARNAEGSLAPSGPAQRLAPGLESCHSPAVSPSGGRVVMLSAAQAVADGTHNATARLLDLDLKKALSDPSTSPRVVIDVVSAPATPDAFPGLYALTLPDETFLDEDTLLINTQWRSQTCVALVDLASPSSSPSITPLTPLAAPPLGGAAALAPGAPGSDACSWSLVSASGRVLVATKVGPTTPPTLMMARLPASPSSPPAGPLTWHPIDLWEGAGGQGPGTPPLADQLSNMAYTIMRVAVPCPGSGSSGSAKDDSFENIVFYPKDRKGPFPTIIAPHGGPHTAVALGWYPAYSFLTSLGYAVLLPNYRGSTGYGQAALGSLPGRCGRQDVDDCMACLQAAIDAGLSDPSRLSVIGGSHGGFLTGHLVGQFPDTFKAGVMRNPVTNISLMVGLTDILDWCYVEVFGCQEGKRRARSVPTPEDLQAMFAVSPAAVVDKVKAPMLLLLGAKDRRVPPPDGQQYLSALRASGVPARCIMFPEDSHALDRPQTEYEQWINAAWWLSKHGAAPAAADA